MGPVTLHDRVRAFQGPAVRLVHLHALAGTLPEELKLACIAEHRTDLLLQNRRNIDDGRRERAEAHRRDIVERERTQKPHREDRFAEGRPRTQTLAHHARASIESGTLDGFADGWMSSTWHTTQGFEPAMKQVGNEQVRGIFVVAKRHLREEAPRRLKDQEMIHVSSHTKGDIQGIPRFRDNVLGKQGSHERKILHPFLGKKDRTERRPPSEAHVFASEQALRKTKYRGRLSVLSNAKVRWPDVARPERGVREDRHHPNGLARLGKQRHVPAAREDGVIQVR